VLAILSRFPPMLCGAAFSTPAFSVAPVNININFHSNTFISTLLSYRAHNRLKLLPIHRPDGEFLNNLLAMIRTVSLGLTESAVYSCAHRYNVTILFTSTQSPYDRA